MGFDYYAEIYSSRNEKFIPVENDFWESMVITQHPFSIKLNKITALYVTLFKTLYEPNKFYEYYSYLLSQQMVTS